MALALDSISKNVFFISSAIVYICAYLWVVPYIYAVYMPYIYGGLYIWNPYLAILDMTGPE
jgi:hypothetical protein